MDVLARIKRGEYDLRAYPVKEIETARIICENITAPGVITELLRLARLGQAAEKAHNKAKSWEYDAYGQELFYVIDDALRAEKGAG